MRSYEGSGILPEQNVILASGLTAMAVRHRQANHTAYSCIFVILFSLSRSFGCDRGRAYYYSKQCGRSFRDTDPTFRLFTSALAHGRLNVARARSSELGSSYPSDCSSTFRLFGHLISLKHSDCHSGRCSFSFDVTIGVLPVIERRQVGLGRVAIFFWSIHSVKPSCH